MKFEINETNIRHAEKMYNTKKGKPTAKIFLIITILIFIFFMTSSFIFPSKITSKENVTVFKTEIPFASNRTFNVLSEEYSKDQKTLEVLVQFNNNNFDGINDYYIVTTVDGSNKKMNTEIPVKNDLLYVIRITELNSFDECKILFAPKVTKLEDVPDDQVGTIIINKHNNNIVKHINLNKTEKDYLIDRINFVVEELKTKLDNSIKKQKSTETQIQGLENENAEIENSKSYLVDVELANANAKIIENKNKILTLQTQLVEQKEAVVSNTTNYNDALAKQKELSKQ